MKICRGTKSIDQKKRERTRNVNEITEQRERRLSIREQKLIRFNR